MQDGLLCALERVDGAADELFPARRQDLQPDIVGYYAGGLNEALCEVEVGLRGRGEGHFDLLVAESCEHLEVHPLLLAVLHALARSRLEMANRAHHRINQRLVAVSQIC
jgi:hypothetical protein